MDDLNFSVSMCVYGKDNPEWFETAVDSILNQTVKPSEVVLVVDGPITDDINFLIEKYENSDLFKVIRFAENQGHGNARRAGLAACTNELVAIMDADDISANDRFENQIKVFKNNPDVDVVGGQITEFISTADNVVGKRIVPLSDGDVKQYLKKRCPMNLVTVMFKKSSIEKAGGFIDWYCEEDYYLWARMALMNMHFTNVENILVNVRVGDDMYQRRGGMRYFKSEAKMQKYLLDNRINTSLMFTVNVVERFIVQVLMPNRLRGWVFQKFARS